jgi:hypothetical protein
MPVSHRIGRLLLAAFGVAAMLTMVTAVPAAAQIGPTPGPDCEEGSETERECQEQDQGDGDGQGGECTFGGYEVNCYEPGYGSWVGSPELLIAPGSPVFSVPAAPPLEGCYAQPSGAPWAGNPPPDDVDPDSDGYWAELSCFGEVPPAMPPQSSAAAVWLPGAPAGPDPEELARRALASITLRQPEFTINPPTSGSVPLGMPVWLAIEESSATWGPISSPEVCDQGLCVTVTAVAETVQWQLGDGSTVQCGRGQNTPWRPGLNFLQPGDACHHVYQQPSRDEQGGSYTATATVTWRADWEGGGQSGAFTDITDVCGASSDEPCTSTVEITVVEILVVGAR